MVFQISPDDLPHITALGAVVVEWGHLESDVGGLLYTFNDLTDSDDDREKFYATFGHLDLRTRLSICKTRGYIYSKGLPNDWYVSLVEVLNYIEADLRNTRNRFIHDIWLLQGRSKKINYKPQVRKPQAGKFVLEFGVSEVVKPDEILLFCEKLRSTRLALQCLIGMTHQGDRYEVLSQIVTQFIQEITQDRRRPKESSSAKS